MEMESVRASESAGTSKLWERQKSARRMKDEKALRSKHTLSDSRAMGGDREEEGRKARIEVRVDFDFDLRTLGYGVGEVA